MSFRALMLTKDEFNHYTITIDGFIQDHLQNDEALGFIASVVFMLYVSAAVVLCGVFGGLDISPLSIKQYWWYAPLICGVIGCWYLLFTNAPFTLTIS